MGAIRRLWRIITGNYYLGYEVISFDLDGKARYRELMK